MGPEIVCLSGWTGRGRPTFQTTPSKQFEVRQRGDEHVGVDEGEIADEDGDALAEPPGLAMPALDPMVIVERSMGSRHTSPTVGSVRKSMSFTA